MNFYKSKNSAQKLDEITEILKKEVIREHKKEDMDFKMNEKKIRDISIKGVKNYANLYRRFTQSSEHKYEMSQLVRQKDEFKQQNTAIINQDIRIQLAQMIKCNLSSSDNSQLEVAIFAIEQLLQKKENLPNPEGMASVFAFKDRIHKINVGIKKVQGLPSIPNFSEESLSIEKQYVSSYDKLKYLSDILIKGHELFGEDSEGMKKIEAIEINVAKTGTLEAVTRANILKSAVQESLKDNGITTGFDTTLQTMWKKIKQLAKRLFANKKKPESIGDGENISPVNTSSDFDERVKALETPVAKKKENNSPELPKKPKEMEEELQQ